MREDGAGAHYEQILPDDLWSLGIDRATLSGWEDGLWYEHVFPWAEALHVLRECLRWELSLVLWSIVYWGSEGDGNWGGPGMLWDGTVPRAAQDGTKKVSELRMPVWDGTIPMQGPDGIRVIELPRPQVRESSLNAGIAALEGIRSANFKDSAKTRYTLDFHKTDAEHWPPDWPKSGVVPDSFGR